jgi:tRNA pseudouridine55 synthase
MHGFININKPLGMTSHDVISRVRRISGIRRVGHAGTLDPQADGVLVVALGHATRLIEYVQDDTVKGYRATVQFGTATDSDDASGQIIRTASVPSVSTDQLLAYLRAFTGNIQQVPPKVSALHHDGQRMYNLARQGIAPDLPARPVTIHTIELLSWQADTLVIDVHCGKGTYIRALARDIGVALASVAHLRALTRTQVGQFLLSQSVALDALTPENFAAHVTSVAQAVADWPHYQLNATELTHIQHGRSFDSRYPLNSRVALFDEQHTLVAVAHCDEQRVVPMKVFAWES